MEYSLNLWCGECETPDKVTFQFEDEAIKIDRLTDCIVINLLRLLNEAKLENPHGLYLPVRHNPSRSGDEFFVLRDGFFKLRPVFRDIIKEILDDSQDRRAKAESCRDIKNLES